MKTPILAAALFTAALLGSGCSTTTAVTDITDLPKDRILPGVPFRVKTEHVVHIFKYDEEKGEYEEATKLNQLLANQRKLYAINLDSAVFASKTLAVSAGPDNTLKKVQTVSTDTSASVVDALTSTLTGVAKAETDKKSAVLANAKGVVDADKAVRDAQKDLDGLAATASAESRATYQAILDSAKRQSNAARSAAGLPVLF